ncbi:MAG: 2'-5' RNA ligase family protein [Candidatus Neomarinimicrobiota bacterium]
MNPTQAARSQTYSLWFMPRGTLYRSLEYTIARLSQAWGTPRFEPHVTLLGALTGLDEKIIQQTARLAGLLQSPTIQLTSLSGSETYFRCLYIRVEPTAEVLAIHQQARELFQQPDEPPFRPHLSLMYGHQPRQVRNDIIDRLGDKFQGEFIANELHLCDTTGVPDSWQRVRSFSLI